MAQFRWNHFGQVTLLGGLLLGCNIKPSKEAGQLTRDMQRYNACADAAKVAESSGASTSLKLQDASVVYDPDIKAIMEANCTNCHSRAAANEVRQAPNLDTYAAVYLASEASLVRMEAGTMPPAGSPAPSTENIGKFRQWIEGGHLVDRPEDRISSTDPVTYHQDIAPYLAAQCTSCHAAGATSPDLSTYGAAKEVAESSWEQISTGLMPPGAPSSDAEKNKFKAWLDGGLAEGTPPANLDQELAPVDCP